MKSKADELDIEKLRHAPVDLKKSSFVEEKKFTTIDTSKFVDKTNYNAKIKDIEYKIPSITNLATTAALTAVQNKIPNVSNLVKKADYVAKISDIKGKYFTISNYNKFANNILDAKITKQVS